MRKKDVVGGFQDLYGFYIGHLSDEDQPRCYVAYCRAEADYLKKHGERKYANWQNFRNAVSNSLKKRNK